MENGRKAVKFFFHCLSSLEEERKLKACFFLPSKRTKKRYAISNRRSFLCFQKKADLSKRGRERARKNSSELPILKDERSGIFSGTPSPALLFCAATRFSSPPFFCYFIFLSRF
jgi:hypothetical protein